MVVIFKILEPNNRKMYLHNQKEYPGIFLFGHPQKTKQIVYFYFSEESSILKSSAIR